MLKKELSQVTDDRIVSNYHPDKSGYSANLFAILEKSNRFNIDNGAYYVIEEGGNFISSAGWNKYCCDNLEVALLLTRMYVSPKYRGKYTVGKHILPLIWQETMMFNTLWMTFNEHNSVLHSWFTERYSESKLIPDLYKNFRFIGTKEIYYTTQYVYQYSRI
jgi:hypothetical protein